MSQGNIINPTTIGDYEALKAIYTAQADAATAQARLIASQKAVAAAQVTEGPEASQLLAATQAANLSAQQKLLSENKAAILKNDFAVPDSGYAGGISLSSQAGTIETTLLSTDAINIAATGIAKAIGKHTHVLIFASSDLPDFHALISYQAQYGTIDKLLDAELTNIDQQLTSAAPLTQAITEAVTPAVIGSAFEAANKLLGFLRTDYTMQGTNVTPDDFTVVNALAGKLRDNNPGATISLPAIYNADAVFASSSVITDVGELARKRVVLQQKTDIANSRLDALTTAISKADPTAKQQMIKVASDLKAAVDQGKASLGIYDGLIAKLTTPDDKGKVPLTTIIQQTAIKKALGGGAAMVVAKVSYAGGTQYTRKNLWSFFGGMPFFIMGGAVVTYAAMDGKTGGITASGAVPIDSGFYKIGSLPKKFRSDNRAGKTE